MSELKALSLWQPWASLISIGAKKVETRSWSTPYRGLLAIHAALKIPDVDLLHSEPFESALDIRARGVWMPLGAIVAVAELLWIVPTEHFVWNDGPLLREFPTPTKQYMAGPRERAFGDFTPGRFGWVLGDPWSLPEPIPCRGARGLWPAPDYVVERIRDQGVRL